MAGRPKSQERDSAAGGSREVAERRAASFFAFSAEGSRAEDRARVAAEEQVVLIPVRWYDTIEYAIVDREDDARLGLSKVRWHSITGYAHHKTFGYMHRAVLDLVKGDRIVHHVNEDKLDNRRSNLQVFETRSEANLAPHPIRDYRCGLTEAERERLRAA